MVGVIDTVTHDMTRSTRGLVTRRCSIPATRIYDELNALQILEPIHGLGGKGHAMAPELDPHSLTSN